VCVRVKATIDGSKVLNEFSTPARQVQHAKTDIHKNFKIGKRCRSGYLAVFAMPVVFEIRVELLPENAVIFGASGFNDNENRGQKEIIAYEQRRGKVIGLHGRQTRDDTGCGPDQFFFSLDTKYITEKKKVQNRQGGQNSQAGVDLPQKTCSGCSADQNQQISK